MPEGPEVKFIAEYLRPLLLNSLLLNIKILQGPYLKNKSSKYKNFIKNKSKILNKKITSINVKGKYTYIKLQDYYFGIHLGMSGMWSLKKDNNSILKLKLITKDKNKLILYFNDQRRFATFKIMNQTELIKKLSKIGPDIYHITYKEFKSLFDKKKFANKKISFALIQQDMISGIGNYLRSEILYVSKIHPNKLAKNLDK